MEQSLPFKLPIFVRMRYQRSNARCYRYSSGRRSFPTEAMVCSFIVMKCEDFSQITDLMDYLDNNRLIAHYCGVNIMELLLAVALAAVLSGSHSSRASKSFRRGA